MASLRPNTYDSDTDPELEEALARYGAGAPPPEPPVFEEVARVPGPVAEAHAAAWRRANLSNDEKIRRVNEALAAQRGSGVPSPMAMPASGLTALAQGASMPEEAPAPSLLDRLSSGAADAFTGSDLQARMRAGEQNPRLSQAAATLGRLGDGIRRAAGPVMRATGLGAAAEALQGPEEPLPDVSMPLPGTPPMATPATRPAPRAAARRPAPEMEPAPNFEMKVAPTPFADEMEGGAPPGPPSPLALAQQRQAANAPAAKPDPLQLALEASGNSRLIANLARAGGTAIGRGTGPGYDALEENADRPLADYAATQQEAERQRVAGEREKSAALAAQEADPNSPQSLQARALAGAMLGKAFTDRPELQGMSAAQLKASFPMLKELGDQQMGAASLAARAEEGRLNRAHDLSMARARRGVGAGGAREADVQKLGKDTEGMARIRADVQLLEKLAASPEGQDIPGAGVWDTKKPGFMQSTADTDAYQATLRVASELLHQQSGASVTPQEAERFLESRGMGKGTTEQQFRAGAKALVRDLRAELAAKVNKYPGAAKAEAQRRGVIMDLPPGAAAASGPVQVASVAEYNALPPGTAYIDPNGKPKVKR